MSVTINNVSERPSEDGINYYEVVIGNEVIASFAHIRSDGLAQCLRRAANAVELRDRAKAAGIPVREG
jgi:hypothetical protein